MSAVRIRCDLQPHQRRLPQIQSLLLRLHALLKLLNRIAIPIQPNLLHWQGRPAIDHLHRLRQLLPQHRCAQHVVTIHHLLNRTDEILHLLL